MSDSNGLPEEQQVAEVKTSDPALALDGADPVTFREVANDIENKCDHIKIDLTTESTTEDGPQVKQEEGEHEPNSEEPQLQESESPQPQTSLQDQEPVEEPPPDEPKPKEDTETEEEQPQAAGGPCYPGLSTGLRDD